MTFIGDVFFNLDTPKNVVRKCLKRPNSEDPLRSNTVNEPKQCGDLKDRTFTIFIYHCEGKSVGKGLS